ncbi:MAG: winged helix-turn-helix transcriptional regulator, partial [Nakamurella sp.]
MLEELDARIAAVLAADGRCSYTDLAERVGLSVSAVHQRVRRLEKRGVIRGYSAQIDTEQIGLPL